MDLPPLGRSRRWTRPTPPGPPPLAFVAPPPASGWIGPPPALARPKIHPREIQPAEWTGLVYLAADNDLSGHGRTNLLQMEEVGSIPGRLNLLVLADVGPTPGQPADWPVGTRLYFVERGAGDHQVHSRELYVEPRSTLGQLLAQHRGRLDTGDPEVLRATIEYVQRNVPSRRFFLDLWNHGDAWRGVGYDAHSRNYLDLARGDLERALSGLSIDLLGADACLFATIEVAALAERLGVSSLVGSPELEPAAGWHYGDLLRRFTRIFAEHERVEAHQLSTQLVRSYAAGENQVLSATHLTHLPKLKAALRDLSARILEGGGLSGNPALLALYQEARRYGREQIDLGVWCGELARRFPEGPLVRAAVQLLMELRASTLSLAGQAEYNLSSLSIHAPSVATLRQEGLDEAYRLGAWQDLGWTAVLDSLRAPPSGVPVPAWATPHPGGPPPPSGAPPIGPDDHRPSLTRLSQLGPRAGDQLHTWPAPPAIYSTLGPQLWIEGELPGGGWSSQVNFEVLGPRRLRAQLSVFRAPGEHPPGPHRLSLGVPLPIGSGREGPYTIEVVGLSPHGPQPLRTVEWSGPGY